MVLKSFFHFVCLHIIVCMLYMIAFSDGTRRHSSSDVDATVYNAEILFGWPGNK